MAADESIVGKAVIELRAENAKLRKDLEDARAGITAAMSKVEADQKRASKAIQSQLDRINAVRPTKQMETLAAAVQKAGGVAALSGNQLDRLRVQVEGLAAAGAKIPASLKLPPPPVQPLEDAFSRSTSKAGAFADSLGRVSTTLARSAGAFGLPVGPLRAIDDVADVAEIGLSNLTKAAVGFNAASLGVVGAGLAIGSVLGSLANRFQIVRDTADSVIHPLARFVGLAGEIDQDATKGLGEFSKQMAASNAEAVRKQVASQKALGVPIAEIAKLYKGTITPELAKQLGLTEKQVEATEKQVEAAKRIAEERRKFAETVKRGISDRMIEEMAGLVTLPDLLKIAPGAKKEGTAAAMVDRFTGSRLPGESVSGIVKAQADAEEEKAKAVAKATAEADRRTQQLVGTFGTLSGQLTNLSGVVGGFGGKLLGVAASLSSGAGGIFSGIVGFKNAGKETGFLGVLGKVSSSLGIVGSAIGAVGGLVSGIKSLFGGKSKEQKAAESAAKQQAAEEAKALAIETAQRKQAAGEAAKGFAESLSARLASGELSEKLAGAVGQFVGRLGDALGKLGLGVVDARLKDSKEFQAATGVAGEVAGGIGKAREAGILDAGLIGATSVVAGAIREEAIAAAQAAGLSDVEAAKQGSLAIAQILREQLNASVRSGNELDANTQALLEEAKKNGIEILADPAIETLAVNRQQLDVLQKGFGVVADAVTTVAGPAGLPAGVGVGTPSATDGGFIDTMLRPALERFSTTMDRFNPGAAAEERFGALPEGAGIADGLAELKDVIARVQPISVTSSPSFTVHVDGTADERIISAAVDAVKGELRKRDAELDELIARSADRAAQ